MARDDRDTSTSDVTSNARSGDDSYGGFGPVGSAVVVTGYTFSWFPENAWSQQQTAKKYGLSEDAETIRISGPYEEAIVAGQFVTVDGNTHRILAANKVKGRIGTPLRFAMKAVRQAVRVTA